MSERKDPKDVLKQLQDSNAPRAMVSSATVYLGPDQTSDDDPNFQLAWSAVNPGSNDFVALYSSTSQPDSEYLRNQWQWVTDGSPFATGTDVTQGYEARYLVYNGSEYVSVARTGAYIFPTINGST